MQPTLFPTDPYFSVRYRRFQDSDLGRLRASLPIKELAQSLPPLSAAARRQSWFTTEGKIALQFLKPYLGLSDAALLERLNTDWALQLFCGLQLKENEQIKDKNLVWQTRTYIAQYLDIEQFQKILIDHWRPHLKAPHTGFSDATCYESYIKRPTDTALLWDSVEWLHAKLVNWSRALGQARPRNKYLKYKRRYFQYARLRRKPYKKRRKMCKGLIGLCNKLLGQVDERIVLWLERQEYDYNLSGLITKEDLAKYQLIGKIYEQQRFHYDQPEASVPKRIVSLAKPYIRPIIRGKESTGGKRTEFGAKLNTWMVDGLHFIEHFSFEAFHEGNRLQQGVAFHFKHFGKLHRLGADAIYATNENRRFCKKLHISTNFKPKGRRTIDPVLRKQEDQIRNAIAKVRSTQLEGAYGNDKNHYGLQKVKARNQLTEKAWIFFAMMCANANKIAKRQIVKLSKGPPNKQGSLKLAA